MSEQVRYWISWLSVAFAVAFGIAFFFGMAVEAFSLDREVAYEIAARLAVSVFAIWCAVRVVGRERR